MECEKEENKHYEKQGFPNRMLICHAKYTFSKHRLMKTSMTCVYIKPEVTKRYNSNDVSCK